MSTSNVMLANSIHAVTLFMANVSAKVKYRHANNRVYNNLFVCLVASVWSLNIDLQAMMIFTFALALAGAL